MAETVSLPLSALNGVPGVGGIDDVVLEIPEEGEIFGFLGDIREDVIGRFDDVDDALDDIQDELDGLDDLPSDVAEELDLDGLADLADEFPTPEDIADAITTQQDLPDLSDADIEIEGSLFSIEQDFTDLLAEAFDVADLDEIDQFPDLGSIEDRLDGLDVPSLDDIGDEVETAVENVFEGLPGGTLLTDPDQFIEERAEDIQDLLVDPELVEELEDALEDFEEEV